MPRCLSVSIPTNLLTPPRFCLQAYSKTNTSLAGACGSSSEFRINGWQPLAILDEIWVPSEFVRRAFVASGVSLPCRIVPPQLEPPAPAGPDRARFGIDADAFAVLFAFSLRSGVVRKNAMAAVRAFLKAFPDNGDVRLIFKISDVDIEGAAWKDFRAAVGNDRRFVFITEFFTDHEMLSLYASIDVACHPPRRRLWHDTSARDALRPGRRSPPVGRPISIS